MVETSFIGVAVLLGMALFGFAGLAVLCFVVRAAVRAGKRELDE